MWTMSDFVKEFTESVEKVAQMMDLINKVTGVIQPIVVNINGVPMALVLQPVSQEPAPEQPVEEEVVEAPVEDAPVDN